VKTSLQIRSQKHLEHLFSDCFWDCSEVFQEKNHFKVNVRLRPSNWHINKNLQKIKSILYQDSCWINRSPWERHSCYLETPWMPDLETAAANTLDDWSWDCCCKHFGWLILRPLLQTPYSIDLKTAVVNILHIWSQDCCCEHLAQLISRLLLRTPCIADLKTTVANTFLNWSQDCCCKHLM